MEPLRNISYLILLIIGFVEAAVLPIDKCTATDKTCMILAIQKMIPTFTEGIPEYGVEVLDPMVLNEVNFELSGLQFSLSDGLFRGLKNVIVNDIVWDWDKKVVNIKFYTDVSIDGKYHADGKILSNSINGDGEIKINIKNVQIDAYLNYEVVKKDNKDYLKATTFDLQYEVKDNANFDLTNLFNGNEKLSEPILKLLNENWKSVIDSFGRPIIGAAASKLVKNINNFLNNIPVEDFTTV